MKKAFTWIVLLMLFAGGYAHAQTQIKDGSLQELPQIVDFELFDGTNLSDVYPGWQEGSGFQQPQYGGGAWFRGYELHGSNTASIIFSTTGLKDDWIISPQFLATETTKVSFKAALTRFWDDPVQGNFAHNDSVSVIVSTNTSQFEFVHVVHSFKLENQPTRHLEMYQFDLSEFAGQLIHLAFYATNGQEANSIASFHLDDIEIKNAVARDAMPLSMVSPAATDCFGQQTPVTVEIRNDGYEAISAVPVKVRVRGPVNENLFAVHEGTLQPGQEAEVLVGYLEDLPHGDYSFSVSTELAGDTYHYNNELPVIQRSNPEPLTLPLPFMNFMGFYSSNLGDVYPGWYEARGKDYPRVAMNVDWQGDNLSGIRTASVYYTGLGTEDWMVSPKFTATENLVVELKAAAQYIQGGEQMGSDDKLALMVSTDCGATWEEAAAITQADGLTATLQDFLFELPQYDGEEIILAFYATTGNVNNPQQYILHITDVSIKNLYEHDAGITRLLSPGNSCAFSDSEEVVVEVKNFGSEPISDFQVAYSLNGADPVVETIAATLSYNQIMTYTFTSTIDLTQQDDNVLDVYTILENDQNSDNDGLMNVALTLSSFDLASEGTYTMSFEEDEDFSAWLVEDGNNDGIEWELVDDPQHARTGDFSYAYFSNQSNSPSDDWLFTPCFYLQEGATYYVSFYYKNRATNWPESLKLMLGQQQASSSMNITLVDLGAISNSAYMKAEATFTVDNTGEYYLGWHAYGPADQFGMHIDDVSIYQVFDQDLAIVNFIAPRDADANCSLNNVEAFELHISNVGSEDMTGINIDLEINQGTPVSFTINETLEAGESMWVTLENGFSLNPDEYYHLVFTITNDDDQNAANNTLVVEDFLHANYYMGFEDYEDTDSWTLQSLAGVNEWHIQDVADLSNTGQNSLAIRTDGTGGNDANDDWAITGCFELLANTCYEISFAYRSRFSTENLAVYMGTDNDHTAMNDMLIDLPSFNSNVYLHASQQFTVEEDGTYYFGWHTDGGTSGRYFIYIDDIAIVEDAEAQPVANPVANVIDTEVQFIANAESYSFIEWDFGDGNTAGTDEVFHVYETPGTYQVTLTLGSGCVDVTYELEVILECEMDDDFAYTIDGTTVTFTATGDATGYEWDFGDGNTGGGAVVTHTYQNLEPQTFNVIMTGYYACGTNEVEQDVFIEDTWVAPTSYILTLEASPADGGMVVGGGEFEVGETTVVSAIPSENYIFVNWIDENSEVVSTQAAFVFTMPAGDVTLTAVFEAESLLYEVSIVHDLGEAIQTFGEGEYEAGENVTVEVEFMDGVNYMFNGWYIDDELVGEDYTYTFIMPEHDVVLTIDAAILPFVDLVDSFEVNLFPNPASDKVYFTADQPVNQITITDLQGRVVYSAHIAEETGFSVSLDGFRAGMYFVQLHGTHGVAVKKLQVK